MGQRKTKPSPSTLLRVLAPLFWDKKLKAQDLEKYPAWIMCRTLMLGNVEQVRFARSYFGDSILRESLKRRAMDVKTKNFWMIWLDSGKGEDSASKGSQSGRLGID